MKQTVLLLLTAQLAHAAGGPGNALQLDGVDDYVSVPHSTALNAYPLTVTAWVKTSQGSGTGILISKAQAAGPAGIRGWQVFLQNGNVGAFFRVGTAAFVPNVTGGAVADGAWHHLAFVVDASGGKIYVDGALTNSRSWTGTAGTPVGTSDMFIGRRTETGSADFFSGRLEEVTVWNAALSPAQIQANKNRSLTGAEAGLIAYYQCDESGGTFLIDSAPASQGNHGTLLNGPSFFPSGVLPFTPAAETLPASGIGGTTATLNGAANPEGTNTSAWFEWGTTDNFGNITSSQSLGGGTNRVNFSQGLAGLAVNTTYYFRAVASNRLGVTLGADESFTTLALAPPTVQTLPATATGLITDTLNGVANPGGTNTSVWFAWGTTTNYGNTTSAQLVGTGTSDTNFSYVLAAVSGGLTYHFRAAVSNSLGVAFGANQSFVPSIFADIGAGLPGIIRPPNYLGYWQRSAAWGDYDNDGRLDIALSATNPITTIWRNTGAGFTYATRVPLGYSPLSWTDFNNDGHLDLAASGGLIRNTNGGFDVISVPFALPAGYELAGGWPVLQDFNNDGRRDYLLSTYIIDTSGTQFKQATLLSLNGSAGFFPTTNHPVGAAGPLAWGDFDNDGRVDVAVTGFIDQPVSGRLAEIWRNTGNGFTNVQARLPGVVNGSAAWGDYDNDGRLDLLLTGMTESNNVQIPISQIWRNTGAGFSNIQAGLPGVSIGSGEWGDYDNDGRLDILLVGKTNHTTQAGGTISQLWRNSGAGFVRVPDFGVPGTCGGTASWGDYDNDGRLDILLVGYTNWIANQVQGRFYPTGAVSQVWRNFTPLANTPPDAPGGLSVSLSNQTAIFSWNAANDAQTPAGTLSYNLRIGTRPGGGEIVSALALPSGRLQVPGPGNAGFLLSRSIAGLPFGIPLYWSVQAVDSAFAGSAFASEQTLTIYTTLTPPGGSTNNVPGDTNGDGIVSGAELNVVLTNYFSTSPWLKMTNVAGLGGTNVTFALTNDLAGAFSVEYTTDFLNWFFLGSATPHYDFTDTNAPAAPQRNYRLRWP